MSSSMSTYLPRSEARPFPRPSGRRPFFQGERRVPMRTLAALLFTGLMASIALPAMAEQTRDVRRLGDAEKVINQTMEAPDRGIPRELLEKAECVGVFPNVKKAAFVVGGEFGRGVFTCRQKDGTMGAPAFFTIGGGSFGWQFGGKEADLVLLVMNENGVKHLLQDKFSL